jgi:protein TonB
VLTTLTAVPAQAPADRAWSVSLVVHAGLIGLALWLTQSLPGAREHSRDEYGITFLPAPDHRTRVRETFPTETVRQTGPVITLPRFLPSLPPIDVPPTPGWPALPVDPFPGVPGPSVPVVTGPPSPPVAAPMDARTVEEPPVLLSHPAPGYPELLRSAGIEGRVVVEAVLDTAGRVERGSLRIVSSTHALFVPEASALVLGSRYRPARFGGMVVRVRIQVPVNFAIRR